MQLRRIGKAAQPVNRQAERYAPLRTIPRDISRYLHEGPRGSLKARHWQRHAFERWATQEEAKVKSLQAKRPDIVGPALRRRLQDELDAENPTRSEKAHAEQMVADKLEEVGGYRDKVDRMRSCRKHGVVALKPDIATGNHKKLVYWDEKCGVGRLCPHEARQDALRLIERYLPVCERHLAEDPTNRIYYGVFSPPNYAEGSLSQGHLDCIEQFNQVRTKTLTACPLHPDYGGNGREKRNHPRFPGRRRFFYKPTRKTTMPAFPEIVGAMIIVEDPLSKHYDWNVHCNAILLTEGELGQLGHAKRFGYVQQEWGHQCRLREIRADGLRRQFIEAVKYAVRLVPEKSEAKASAGLSKAPAFTEWPNNCVQEWMEAQKGFRRVRSYGKLYAPDGALWNSLPPVKTRPDQDGPLDTRLGALVGAGVDDWDLAYRSWKSLSKERRIALRRVLRCAKEAIDPKSLIWLGEIWYDGASYRASLITEDNFANQLGLHGDISRESSASVVDPPLLGVAA